MRHPPHERPGPPSPPTASRRRPDARTRWGRRLGKRRRAQLTQKAFQDMGYDVRDRRLLLMMEDLAWALEEYSVKVAQPAYFADFNAGPAKGLPR